MNTTLRGCVVVVAFVVVPTAVFAASVGSGGSACTQDVWDCGAWGSCGLNRQQTRDCLLTLDCPNTNTPPQPEGVRSCTPDCTQDVWDCGVWGPCLHRAQQRICTKTSDCAIVETPMPATTARCSLDCGLDQWACGTWGACSATGVRTRTCALRDSCEDGGVAKPAEQERCTPGTPASTVKKPASTPTQETSKLLCGNLKTLAERVRCRLNLAPAAVERELAIQYLPEECRAMSEGAARTGCIDRYQDIRPCWSRPIGAERLTCVRAALGLGDLRDERAACNAQEGAAQTACHRARTQRAYPYITFRFYDLEERAEGLLKIGASAEAVASFVTVAEQAKVDFNAAENTDTRIAVIRRVQTAWRDFVHGLPYGVVERARAEGIGTP